MPLTGIHNENEFYSHHYLAEIFAGDIQGTLERWREQAEAANARTPWAELRALAPEYLRFRGDFNRERRPGQRILRQREWFRTLLGALGYGCQPANLHLEDGSEVPILCADGGSAGTPRLLALGAFDATGEGEDPLSLKPHALQFHGEAPTPEAVLNETWETIVTRRLFARTIPRAGCSSSHAAAYCCSNVGSGRTTGCCGSTWTAARTPPSPNGWEREALRYMYRLLFLLYIKGTITRDATDTHPDDPTERRMVYHALFRQPPREGTKQRWLKVSCCSKLCLCELTQEVKHERSPRATEDTWGYLH